MRVVIQRVASASVTIAGVQRASIGRGLLALVAAEAADGPDDIAWLSGKLVRLRVFPDADGKMNLALADIGGEVLVVSQFTLFASTRQGNRPAFTRAARPEQALPLYQAFVRQVAQDLGRAVQTGDFGADMQVALVNDGPVTISIDSRARE
jgi:D-tyrosyl-tRNA(Tyr) deacylase